MSITCYPNVDPVKMAYAAGLLVPLGLLVVKEITYVASEAWKWGTKLETAYQQQIVQLNTSLTQTQASKARDINQELRNTKECLQNTRYLKFMTCYSACALIAIPIILMSLHCYNHEPIRNVL